ncbi:MAG: Gfo/Idh/MocA family oxidoreductase [Planctomycetaceae bacterium]|nr:Gfo/Idh/MocA family oxidoreductase [Planctomycetaceae bacterium]
MQEKTRQLTRRSFLVSSAASAGVLTLPLVPRRSAAQAPSMRLRVASFGAARRAWANITGIMSVSNTELVAVAEVDDRHLRQVRSRYPDTKVYKDFRRLLDGEAKNLDAVVIGTPDHMHAAMAMHAMQAGLHVYCEKPLTRTLHEARTLRNYAEENGIITQMGNQRAQGDLNQTTVRALRSGIVGTVREIHCMQAKTWGSMQPLRSATAPPKDLDWDLWIGVRPSRPYVAEEFHPRMWRSRLGFGCGNLGDMGCHIFHPWFMGLDVGPPLTVKSFGPGPANAVSWPTDVRVRWEFDGTKLSGGKPFTVTWHDGGQSPPDDVAKAVGGRKNLIDSGSIIIGSAGSLIAPHGRGAVRFFVEGVEEKNAFELIKGSNDHHGNFTDAIRGQNGVKQPLCHFGYSAPMAEAVLVGTYAVRLPGDKLFWNAKELQFTNSESANNLVREKYRKGWEVAGL